MPKKRLTEEGVAKLKPPSSGQVDYFDTVMPGLVLRLNYGGAKAWRAMHYVTKTDKTGKRLTQSTTYKLGKYPHLRLKEARERARQFLADPQKALTQVATGSFQDVAENFIKRHVEHEKLRTQDEIERVLRRYVYPRWAPQGDPDAGPADRDQCRRQAYAGYYNKIRTHRSLDKDAPALTPVQWVCPRWVKKLKQRKTGILSSSGVARSDGATTICRTLNIVHRNGCEPINDWSPGLTGLPQNQQRPLEKFKCMRKQATFFFHCWGLRILALCIRPTSY
jgi:hypothetical protein